MRFILALGLLACNGPLEDTEVVVDDPLPSGIHRLSGDTFDLPLDDLAPLSDILAEADVVGVGESIHFSNGFHAQRARIMKKLIAEDGFRLVALEGYWQDATLVQTYIETCDPADLTTAMQRGMSFAAWYSVSSGEFLEWVCEYNTEHPQDPVAFVGSDVQWPWRDVQWLKPRIGDDTDLDVLSTCIGGTLGPDDDPYTDPTVAAIAEGTHTIEPEDTEACLAGVQTVRGWAAVHDDAIDTRIALRSLEAGQQEYSAQPWYSQESFEARDSGMADVLMMQRERAGAPRTLYWAHNFHIMAAANEVVASP